MEKDTKIQSITNPQLQITDPISSLETGSLTSKTEPHLNGQTWGLREVSVVVKDQKVIWTAENANWSDGESYSKRWENSSWRVMACYLSIETSKIVWLENHALGKWLKPLKGNWKIVIQNTNPLKLAFIEWVQD